jgi:protein ImuB
MLWLCLNFPRLALEIFSRVQAAPRPLVLTDGRGTPRHVFLGNAEAEALGIRAGMSLSAAQGLADGLQIHSRDETAERQALEALASWSGQFTSLVSLLPPQSLLLEIKASLTLFGGIAKLLHTVRSGITSLGYETGIGTAPTPLGAWLLARAGIETPVMSLEGLARSLHPLPLDALAGDENLSMGRIRPAKALSGLGLRCLGDVLRLPRAGLARRLGPEFVDYLDRLLGRRPDPRRPYTPPPVFERRLSLPAETIDQEALLFPAHRLLLELEGFLTARDAGTQRLCWTLLHPRRPPTHVTMGLSTPGRDPEHLLDLLKERLGRLSLDRPVAGVTLRVSDLHPFRPRALRLDGQRTFPAKDWPLLVEKLRARLGDEAVQGLRYQPDHRPERAWLSCPPGQDDGLYPSREQDLCKAASRRRPASGAVTPPYKGPPRPLWLLPEPRRLITRNGSPWIKERLRLLEGPERIESGWWDGGDVRRDYFVASDSSHARYWIFRERTGERRWFLHGLFA